MKATLQTTIFIILLIMNNITIAKIGLMDGAHQAATFILYCLKTSSIEDAEEAANLKLSPTNVGQDETARSLKLLTEIGEGFSNLEVIGVSVPQRLGMGNGVIVFTRFFTNDDAYVFEVRAFLGASGKWTLRQVNYIDPWEENDLEKSYNLIETPFPVEAD